MTAISAADVSLEARTMRRVSWRLLPLVIVIYFIAYIDRSNVGFASTGGMSRELGLSAYIYGWGAGIFFLGYFIFEVPSNLLLERVGARRWIARIMVTWGLVSMAMIFVRGSWSFLTIRFLLGLAEAGFFPGVLLYFTYWFPSRYRARVIAALFLAGPGSNAVSAAVSGAILQLDGALGLAGWKWLFVLESAPAILLAPVVLLVLADRPATARWLPAEERDWLEHELDAERQAVEHVRRLTLAEALTDKRVLSLSFIYFAIVTATYGITFFLPLIVKAYGLSNSATGLVTAIPYTVGLIAMVLWARSSDRRHERKWHYIGASAVGAVFLALAAAAAQPIVALTAMSVAAAGIYASKPAFWPLPSQFLSGTAAAGGIALVNAIGNLGGFVGPYAVGWIKDSTNSYSSGLYFLAGCAAVSAVVAGLVVGRETRATDAQVDLKRQGAKA
jgi:MFS transporter, ACS family, tartrate transporter